MCVTPSKQKEFSFLVAAAEQQQQMSVVAFSRKSVLDQAFISVSVFVNERRNSFSVVPVFYLITKVSSALFW